MNSWTLIMDWILSIFLPWFGTFTPSEKIALAAALLVLVGVAGEYVIEIPAIEERKRVRYWIKRVSIGLLLFGLAGDVLGIVRGQAEMAALTKEAGDAATSAQKASAAGGAAEKKANAADTEAGKAQQKASDALADLRLARSQLSELDRDIANESLARKALAKALAPRELLIIEYTDRTSNLDALSVFWTKEGPFQTCIESVPDSEAELAANVLFHALTNAGWLVRPPTLAQNPPETFPLLGGLPLGVEIDFAISEKEGEIANVFDFQADEERSEQKAFVLDAFLLQQGWDAENLIWKHPDEIPGCSLKVLVGYKPNPYLESQRDKDIRRTDDSSIIERYGFNSPGKKVALEYVLNPSGSSVLAHHP